MINAWDHDPVACESYGSMYALPCTVESDLTMDGILQEQVFVAEATSPVVYPLSWMAMFVHFRGRVRRFPQRAAVQVGTRQLDGFLRM